MSSAMKVIESLKGLRCSVPLSEKDIDDSEHVPRNFFRKNTAAYRLLVFLRKKGGHGAEVSGILTGCEYSVRRALQNDIRLLRDEPIASIISGTPLHLAQTITRTGSDTIELSAAIPDLEEAAAIAKCIANEVMTLMNFDKPKILAYGICNSGKSTLVNALCGHEAAEAASRPMTYKIDEYDAGKYILIRLAGH